MKADFLTAEGKGASASFYLGNEHGLVYVLASLYGANGTVSEVGARIFLLDVTWNGDLKTLPIITTGPNQSDLNSKITVVKSSGKITVSIASASYGYVYVQKIYGTLTKA